MRTRLIVALIAVVALVVILLGVTSRRGRAAANTTQAANAAAARAIPVAAVPVAQQDMPVYLKGLGTVTAFNTVTVRSRVDGELVRVNFREGQEVKAGDLLAVIDPRPFEAQLHQTEATMSRDQAQLSDAEVNLARYQDLFRQGIIAKQQLDAQNSLVGQLRGAVGADKALVENAKLQLVYSRITAPIGGRVGLRLVDPGNIVHASDTNGMLVITQMQPIAVIFTLPEDYVPTVLKHMQQGPLQTLAYSRDDRTRIATGRLLTLNNEIDPTTGTNRFKAVFENSDRMLWPNQFVNMWLLLDVQKNALIAPAAAIQHGTQGTFVFVVKPDSTAEVRNVKVGITEGNRVSIAEGLAPGEMIVTDGQDKLQPGTKVAVQQPAARPQGNGAGQDQGNGTAPGNGGQGNGTGQGTQGTQPSRS